jgi:hypothetical protein
MAAPIRAKGTSANRLRYGEIGDRGTAQTAPGLAGHWRSDMTEPSTEPAGESTPIDGMWRPIPGYVGYWVTRSGMIRGPRGAMRPMVSDDGYRYIFATRPGVPRKLFLHRAVLMAWVGLPAVGQVGRHLNDNPSDNWVGNLAWGTTQDNANDKIRNGRQPRGELSATAKLTEADVREIRRLHGSMSLRALAAKFDVSHTAIRRAATGMKWGHVA